MADRLSPSDGIRRAKPWAPAASGSAARVNGSHLTRLAYAGSPPPTSGKRPSSGLARAAHRPSAPIHEQCVRPGPGRVLVQAGAQRLLAGAGELRFTVPLDHAPKHTVVAEPQGRRIEGFFRPVREEESRKKAPGRLRHGEDRVGRGLEGHVGALAPDRDGIAPVGLAPEGSAEDLERAGVGDGLTPVKKTPLGVERDPAPLPRPTRSLLWRWSRHGPIIAPRAPGAPPVSRLRVDPRVVTRAGA